MYGPNVCRVGVDRHEPIEVERTETQNYTARLCDRFETGLTLLKNGVASEFVAGRGLVANPNP